MCVSYNTEEDDTVFQDYSAGAVLPVLEEPEEAPRDVLEEDSYDVAPLAGQVSDDVAEMEELQLHS